MKTKLLPFTAIIFFAIFITAPTYTQDNTNLVRLNGTVQNTNREKLDSVWLTIEYQNKIDSLLILNGVFNQEILTSAKRLKAIFSKRQFRSFITEIEIPNNNKIEDINVVLYPSYSILLHGRVRIGNMPLEGVNVEVKHNNNTYKKQTLGCYVDSAEYWNCLYNGMFKTDIISNNPGDSITINFTKSGYKPLQKQIKFSSYDGSVLDIKLQYADIIPNQPLNNFNLKVAPPANLLYPGTENSGWFIDVSYFRHLSKKLNRIAIGAEANMISTNYTSIATFLPNADSTEFDSTFIDLSIAPAMLIWIIKPDRKKFGTYIGNALHYSFITNQFNYQPFIGTRYFLDLRKSISLEFRYLNHNIIRTGYDPQFTVPVRKNHTESDQKWIINLGIQITF